MRRPAGPSSIRGAKTSTPCRFTPRRVPLLRDETESMTNPTRRIRAHGRLFSSHGNRTRDQLRDPRAVEKVTLVNRKLIPPRCLTAWCFRRSMDKRGHCSVLIAKTSKASQHSSLLSLASIVKIASRSSRRFSISRSLSLVREQISQASIPVPLPSMLRRSRWRSIRSLGSVRRHARHSKFRGGLRAS